MPVEDGFVVFGGHTTGFDMTKTAERYNLATDSWTQMNMLYYQDYSAGIVTADGRMLLAGGISGGSGTYEAVGEEAPSKEDMSDTILKLQKRVEQYSTESQVYQEGNNRINIEIPGVSDANKILE